jgi:hypothetical protein
MYIVDKHSLLACKCESRTFSTIYYLPSNFKKESSYILLSCKLRLSYFGMGCDGLYLIKRVNMDIKTPSIYSICLSAWGFYRAGKMI